MAVVSFSLAFSTGISGRYFSLHLQNVCIVALMVDVSSKIAGAATTTTCCNVFPTLIFGQILRRIYFVHKFGGKSFESVKH